MVFDRHPLAQRAASMLAQCSTRVFLLRHQWWKLPLLGLPIAHTPLTPQDKRGAGGDASSHHRDKSRDAGSRVWILVLRCLSGHLAENQ